MPLSWELHHRNNELEWPVRWEGLPGGAAGCCIIRLDDDGSQTSVILRLDDPGDGSSCIEPLSCQDE